MTAVATSTAAATKTAKPVKTVAAKTPKTAKVAKTAETKVRLPAKELMANRKRMFFGAAYMNGVLGGYHRDFDKMVAHAVHLKVGAPSQLKKLSLETLREKLAAAIQDSPDGATPFAIKLQ